MGPAVTSSLKYDDARRGITWFDKDGYKAILSQ